MSESEPLHILCSPHGSTHIAPGSTVEHCADCGQEVDLAPSGQSMARQALDSGQEVIYLCVGCGLLHIANATDPKIRPMTDEQRDEIARYREHNL